MGEVKERASVSAELRKNSVMISHGGLSQCGHMQWKTRNCNWTLAMMILKKGGLTVKKLLQKSEGHSKRGGQL
jgi:hypothetical protein